VFQVTGGRLRRRHPRWMGSSWRSSGRLRSTGRRGARRCESVAKRASKHLSLCAGRTLCVTAES
jgi:hypothetical protein